MKFEVLSRSEAKAFICDIPWACISIADHPDDMPRLNKVQRVDLLQLGFADADEKYYDDDILFTEEHAASILDFIDKVWDKVELIMVHCYAGQCRSPAVAAAINKIKFGNDEKYFKNHLPNMLVYRTILNVANKRGLI